MESQDSRRDSVLTLDNRGPRFVGYLACAVDITLEAFCTALERQLRTPPFAYDAESVNHWAISRPHGREINVSRPDDPGYLQQCLKAIPRGCTFMVLLMIFSDAPEDQTVDWAWREMIPQHAQTIADLFGVEVFDVAGTPQGGGTFVHALRSYTPARR